METAMSVIHLTEFGHVLGVFASGSTEPSIEELTSPDGLGLRNFEQDNVIRVPRDMLSVTRVEFDNSVIDSPRNYRLIDGPPPLVHIPDPTVIPIVGTAVGAPGETWLLLVGVGDYTEVVQPVLDADGELQALPVLPGETAKLLVGPTSGLYFG